MVTAARSPVQSRALSTPRVTRRMPRTVLVASQVAITLVLVTTAAGIFALALLVSLRPALEASRVDLTRSLREE